MTMANLRRAIRESPRVIVFDNDDLARPFRRIAEFDGGRATFMADELQPWFSSAKR